MSVRNKPSPATVSALAREIAGVPLDETAAASHAKMLAALMEEIEALRALPLDDVEPAVIFRPVEDDGGGER